MGFRQERSSTLDSLTDNEWTKILGWPGYRVWRSEIEESLSACSKGAFCHSSNPAHQNMLVLRPPPGVVGLQLDRTFFQVFQPVVFQYRVAIDSHQAGLVF